MGIQSLGQPKVKNLGLSALRDEKICGFHIAMHDPFVVGCIQCIGDLNPEVQHLLGGERLAGNEVFESLPFQQFH